MEFKDMLNEYIEKINCNAKELSNISNISPTVISRYRTGERIPKKNSEQFNKLIHGLYLLMKKKNIKINENDIEKDFLNILNETNVDCELFKNNFNQLITTLNINIADISRYIGFDSSYISKIKNGLRKPSNINEFINMIVKYIVNYYQDDFSKELISSLINTNKDELNNKDNYTILLHNWISNNNKTDLNNINSFLFKLDDFDLNNYIKEIKFDELKVPTIPFSIPKSKNYYGLEEMKQAELDYLKTIVLNKNSDNIFYYSNLPILEMANDKEFQKKFMFGMALLLKKGLHLNIIHNLDRPFKELIVGLEGWIPLYMTGQIHSYYFKNQKSDLYEHIDSSNNIAALTGEAIKGNIKKGKHYVTTKKEEVNYYQEKAKNLLKNASSLMDIYNETRKKEWINYLANNINYNHKNILTNLPIYVINEKLLIKILEDNNINIKEKKEIINYYNLEKKRIEKILKNHSILDEINILNENEFINNNLCLSLSNIFYINNITYSYKDYLKYIECLKDFKKNHSNYDYIINNNNIFKNININIIGNKQVIISKENIPAIHFVIYHPTLVNAIAKVDYFEEKK